MIETPEKNVQKTQIKLPPSKATGNLTIEKIETIQVEDDVNLNEKSLVGVVKDEATYVLDKENVDESELILPEMNTKFKIGSNKYKVCYINDGKGRFSAKPCK